jgi:flagellar hook-associated protein 2
VTLHLAGLSSTTDTSDAASVTVARDDDAIADKIDAFVKAYDAVHDFVAGQSPTKDGKAGGPLSGDPTLLGAERLIQSKVGARYLFGAARVTSLGEIGVSFDGSGRLSLDRSKLSKALDADPNAVRTLLSGDGVTDGAATAVARVLEPLVRSGDGALALRDKGFDARLHDFDRQIEQMNTRLDQRETTLRARFTALESLVSSLQSQAGFLSSITTTTSR